MASQELRPVWNSIGFDFAYLIGFAAILSSVGIVMSWRLLTK